MADLPYLYFLHIPKTAGTSVAEVLHRVYGSEQVLPAYNWQQLSQLPRDVMSRYRCIIGHLGPLPYLLAGRPLTTITVLRDPVERAISHIEYVRQEIRAQTGNCLEHPVARHVDLPLEELLRVSEVRIALSNAQTRWLGMRADASYVADGIDRSTVQRLHAQIREVGDDELLVRARAHLQSMAVVGVVHRMDETMAAICALLGVPAPERTPHVNSGPMADGMTHRVRIGPKIAAELDNLNAHDHSLVGYAGTLLAQTMAGVALPTTQVPRPSWRRRLRRLLGL
ncbi:MAG: sulfotransferase family 2 domain-containing protein [Armatimonadetes bacterium]|nr:sulfotransferase family 2 domain-containing protein [Armatimonadota bacterium]